MLTSCFFFPSSITWFLSDPMFYVPWHGSLVIDHCFKFSHSPIDSPNKDVCATAKVVMHPNCSHLGVHCGHPPAPQLHMQSIPPSQPTKHNICDVCTPWSAYYFAIAQLKALQVHVFHISSVFSVNSSHLHWFILTFWWFNPCFNAFPNVFWTQTPSRGPVGRSWVGVGQFSGLVQQIFWKNWSF